jgi:ubiquinone/menaquinone biosynthesis C-methylase UbiE
MDFEDFVTSQSPPPARILEVGCGTGELAHALAKRGFDITAIDPEAPEGAIFRRARLEEFSEEEPFEAVVASRSLHHVEDLVTGLDKIHSHLHTSGKLMLNEFAWDRMDDRTARWYRSQVDKPGNENESLLPENFPDAWVAEHEGLHDSVTMRETLDRFFALAAFEWVPYIAEHYLKHPDLMEKEQQLIASGDINAVGFRYVGIRS